MDGATIADRRLAEWLMKTAEEAGIPYQIRQPNPGGTDAGAIHKTRAGGPAFPFRCPKGTATPRRSDPQKRLGRHPALAQRGAQPAKFKKFSRHRRHKMTKTQSKNLRDEALLALIRKLVETPGPSGQEGLIRAAVLEEIIGACGRSPHGRARQPDCPGRRQTSGGLRVMISAHIDEIGLMVTHVDANGFAALYRHRRRIPTTCIGGRVLFMNGARGVIGCERLEPTARRRLKSFSLIPARSAGRTARECGRCVRV
jgi:putative aminopeptidase FrvX